MNAPIARIIARYVSSALMTYGLATPEELAILNPDIIAIVGAVIGAITEGAYTYAKRKGWTT